MAEKVSKPTDRVAKCIDALGSEEAELAASLLDLAKQTAATKAELKKIRSAISTLTEKPGGSVTPAPTKQAVVAAIEAELLAAGQSLEEETLRAAVQRRLTAAGRSRAGLALRFKEALENVAFVRDGTGIALAPGTGIRPANTSEVE
jgi:hypothetical protein